jgi:hypothetical protein
MGTSKFTVRYTTQTSIAGNANKTPYSTDYLCANPTATLLDAFAAYRVFAHDAYLTKRMFPEAIPSAYVVCW